jgi:hypothetical protein
MTKIEQMIISDIMTRHDLPEDVAARMVRSVLDHGTQSVYFDVVAPSAESVIRPLWDVVKKTITAMAPLLADVRLEQREPPCLAGVMNRLRRPDEDILVCPMGGNAARMKLDCAQCGQSSMRGHDGG